MSDADILLVKANLKQLKLPTMLAEWEKLAREAAGRDEPYDAYLLRLTEAEVTARAASAVAARIRAAGFPVAKDFDTFDFTATPTLPKQLVSVIPFIGPLPCSRCSPATCRSASGGRCSRGSG